jgi:hypothetical protein
MKTALKIFAIKLLARVAARRQTLSDDIVAETLDEIVDAITETLKELPDDPSGDVIISHLRAHSGDYDVRKREINTGDPLPVPPKVFCHRE